MLSRAALFLFGMFVGACAQSSTVQPTAPNHEAQAHDLASKTVALVTRREDGSARSYCSGVWVGEAAILTAAHCVRGEQEVEYVVQSDVFAPGELHERGSVLFRTAILTALDEDHDLALLGQGPLGGLSGPREGADPSRGPTGHRTAKVSLEPVLAGMDVQTLGHPLGLWWSYSAGQVAAVREMEIAGTEGVWVQTTASISPGNSGCGLFDAQGRLIGIAHGAFSKGQNLNFFVHAQYLDAFLRKNT